MYLSTTQDVRVVITSAGFPARVYFIFDRIVQASHTYHVACHLLLPSHCASSTAATVLTCPFEA